MPHKKTIQLTKDIFAKTEHISPVTEGSEVWRIIINIVDQTPSSGGLIKEYYVWVTGEYLEDKSNLKADLDSAEKFALQTVTQRFQDSGEVPVEKGISFSIKGGKELVDPSSYIHPKENDGK